MTPTEIPGVPPPSPLAGKRVYSAGVIAAYTALAKPPVGCVLYGFNLRARGANLPGRLMIAIGATAGLALFSLAVIRDVNPSQSRMYFLLNLFSAVCFYKFEKGPVRAALREGAKRARWWPPALFLVGALILLVTIFTLFS
jgi:hypothetical protein